MAVVGGQVAIVTPLCLLSQLTRLGTQLHLSATTFTLIEALEPSQGELKMTDMEPGRRDALLAFRQVRTRSHMGA